MSETVALDDAQTREMCQKSRREALLLLAIGVLSALFEWWEITRDHEYHPKMVLVGALALLIGVMGSIEPRLMWGLGRNAKTAPRGFRIAAIAILVVAVGAGLWFCFWIEG